MASPNPTKQAVSNRLSGLRFMQRAKIREDELKRQEAEAAGSAAVDDSHWVTPAASASRCKVIFEGDPKPGAIIGRMSFQSFNPSVDRIVEEVEARREKLRIFASTSTGNDEKPTVNTQSLANGAEKEKVEVDDVDNVSIRKRQKVEKKTISKTETASVAVNSFTALRGGKVESHKREQHQQRETKEVNPRTDWRSLRPPGR
ncbi:uncharacterized protein [Physcomitrium patens]|uniref:M-phase phosphoprotein 6 n=1 Tax=Physcomitrium patens TaxID=3218 RepID=A0A2K1J8S2_PHYPA|nr:uncharacterized protein LOC112292997 [Physcomitrium patens]PNR37921.1 hypothetical protein PHYPA_021031 [Physcomitrium patens]|eukprot:XP_024397793.1 uncharacterized protein LOC112292997 [Physcomitrella patens]